MRISSKELKKIMMRLGLMIVSKAKVYAPIDTGRLRNSITFKIEGNTLYVGTNVEYAPYVEIGTGIYGPRKEPIKPVVAKYLHWIDKEGKEHFAKMVKGIQGTYFLERALRDTLKEVKRRQGRI